MSHWRASPGDHPRLSWAALILAQAVLLSALLLAWLALAIGWGM